VVNKISNNKFLVQLLVFLTLLSFFCSSSLQKINNESNFPYGRYFCEKISASISSKIIDTTNGKTSIEKRIIGEDNGRTLINSHFEIGGLTYNYISTTVSGVLFSTLSKSNCFNNSTILNNELNKFQMFFNLFIVIILIIIIFTKFVFSRNAINIILFYSFILNISQYLFNKYYGLALLDRVINLNNFENNYFRIIIEVAKALFFPKDSYSVAGYHPRNYALVFLVLGFVCLFYKNTNAMLKIVSLMNLFHTIMAITGMLLIIIYFILFDRKQLNLSSLKYFTLTFLIFISGNNLVPINYFLFIHFFIFISIIIYFIKDLNYDNFVLIKYDTTVLNYYSILLALVFLSSFWLSFNFSFMTYFDNLYLVRGAIAEGAQRISPIWTVLFLLYLSEKLKRFIFFSKK